MHRVKEFQLRYIEFGTRLGDLVEIKLIDHVFHREDLVAHEDACVLLEKRDVFTMRWVPSKQGNTIDDCLRLESFVAIALNTHVDSKALG